MMMTMCLPIVLSVSTQLFIIIFKVLVGLSVYPLYICPIIYKVEPQYWLVTLPIVYLSNFIQGRAPNILRYYPIYL